MREIFSAGKWSNKRTVSKLRNPNWIYIDTCSIDFWLNLSIVSAIEATSRSLTTERDNLKKQLNTCNLQKNSLTYERDILKRTNTAMEVKSRSLTTERDKLKTQLNTFSQFAQKKWQYFSGSFYYVSTTKKTWQSSQRECWNQEADLVIINSREEEQFTRTFKTKAWIGLTDIIREGSWKWVDGTSLIRSYWRFGAPNRFYGRIKDCAEIYNFNSERSWNDAECSNENYWICEKKIEAWHEKPHVFCYEAFKKVSHETKIKCCDFCFSYRV